MGRRMMWWEKKYVDIKRVDRLSVSDVKESERPQSNTKAGANAVNRW